MRARIVLSLLLVPALAAGCGGGEDGSAPRVVAALYPIAYAAQRAAPGAVVENLTPAGAEPHDLELSPRDVEQLRAATTVLYLGGGLMPAVEAAVAGRDGAVDLLAGEQPAAEPGASRRDPHVWLDPLRYAVMARRIATALGTPGGAGELVAELESLDDEFRAGLAQCQRRRFVTSHAAFGYLAAAYDLEQIPLTGVAPETEPSARAIERLVEEVERSGATTVFFEPLVSARLAETVAREAGVAVAVLDPLEALTEAQLDAGDDYFSVMRANLAALRKALGCT